MVSTWDLRPFVAWVRQHYLPALRVGPGPGEYARRPGESAPALYGVADAACILYTLGDLDAGPDSAQDWLDLLGSFQDPRSGFFVDRSSSLTTAHNTGFAIGAMNFFRADLRDGRLPRAALRFAQQVSRPVDAERFAASLDWRGNCYETGEVLIGHASSFFNVSDVVAPTWFDWLVEYVESSKLDAANGMVGVGKPRGGDLDQVGGTLHFDFFWAALQRRLPHADARAHALLGLQRPDGLWDDANPWWLSFDAVYMLGRALPELSAADAGRVRAAVARTVTVLAERCVRADLRNGDFVAPWLGAHMLTGALSFFACAQQVLGIERVVTELPLRLVLDRRPYI